MDLMADLMNLLRLEKNTYGCLHLKGPFALPFPQDLGHFLIVTRGHGYLEVGDDPNLALEPGDFVFIPQAQPVTLKSSPEAMTPQPLGPREAEVYTRTGSLTLVEGEGNALSVICGCFTFSSPQSGLLVKHLPNALRLPAVACQENPSTHAVFQLMVTEMAQNHRIGSTAILNRLAETLFVFAIRTYFEEGHSGSQPCWIRALGDLQVGPALQKIHDAPGRGWTVEALADAVGMSRSGFAARFKALVGETPLEHLTQWRMAKAAELIQSPRPPKLSSVAAAVGYESESSFRKAFQKVMGKSPGQYKAIVHAG